MAKVEKSAQEAIAEKLVDCEMGRAENKYSSEVMAWDNGYVAGMIDGLRFALIQMGWTEKHFAKFRASYSARLRND